jgi:ferredoxin-thioredoxin reductase catalytic subunit
MPQSDGDELLEHTKIKLDAIDYAKRNGYTISADADVIIDGLIKKRKKHGKYYCPCRVLKDETTPDGKQFNDTIVCPCNYIHDDIARKGRCHCNLFVKKEG